MEGEVAQEFLAALVTLPEVKRLMRAEHFSVDGTLIEAWASMKSFVRTDGDGSPPPAGGGQNREADFRGEKRSNETHASTTDPDARLCRKSHGRESRFAYMGHVLMENRHGLVVGAMATRATGTAEREAALDLVDSHRKGRRRMTLGAHRSDDVANVVRTLRAREVTPHVAVNGAVSKLGTPRRTFIDRRTLRHAGYGASQRHRKRIEEVFGWIKAQAGFAKAKVHGVARVDAAFTMMAAACNPGRLAGLAATAPRAAVRRPTGRGLPPTRLPVASLTHLQRRPEPARRECSKLLQKPASAGSWCRRFRAVSSGA
jgi:hypothetical protein